MAYIDRKEVVRLKTGLSLTPEHRANFEVAAVAWRGQFPPMVLLQRHRRRCVVCRKNIWESHWPKGLHFCECGNWHAVCLHCVRHYSMVNRPFAESWDYQKLDLCVKPVRAARKFMK